MLAPKTGEMRVILLNILWPTFALVLLIFVMWIVAAVSRIGYTRRVPPTRDTFATRHTADAYFAPVDLPANNMANLFEMPALYFALVPLLLATRSADVAEVGLAWLFVMARIVHSYLHVVVRQVRARFLAHVVGNAILSAMWIGFFIDMVAAALAYNHAVSAFGQP